MPSPVKIIPCDIANCNLPVGEITENTVTIVSRHHGKRHEKVIPKAELLRLLTEQSDTKLLTPDDESVLSCAPATLSHL